MNIVLPVNTFRTWVFHSF